MKLLAILAIMLLSITTFAKTIVLTPDNHIILEDQFNGATTAKVMSDVLLKMSEKTGRKEIYLLLDSPGGEIFSGIQMIDFLKSQKIKVHTISFFAASMGFQTVQGLGKRYLPKNGILMSHLARGGMQGTFPNGSLDATYNLWTDIVTQLDIQAANRTNGKHTLESYRKLIRGDYWCKGQTCVDQGFADDVVDIECNEDLLGVKTVMTTVNFLGMSIAVKLTKSMCPAIRSPLKVEVQQHGEFININEGTFEQDFIDKINNKLTNEALSCGLK